jgi:hypothetical protein
MAKKYLLVLVLAGVLAGGIFAQEAGGLDFTSTTPQFFSFDLGAGVGYNLDASELIGATVVGFKVAVIDNMEIGVDVLNPSASGATFTGLRIGYRFTPALGAAIGIGGANIGINTSTGISLGVFYDLFANRSKNGVATALKVRIDYVAPTSDVAKGALFFTPVFTFGL